MQSLYTHKFTFIQTRLDGKGSLTLFKLTRNTVDIHERPLLMAALGNFKQ